MCQFCESGYFRSFYSCVSNCQINQFPNEGILTCENCPAECGRCSIAGNESLPHCDTCEATYKPVLFEGTCYQCGDKDIQGLYYDASDNIIRQYPKINLIGSDQNCYIEGTTLFIRAVIADKSNGNLTLKCNWSSNINSKYNASTFEGTANKSGEITINSACGIVSTNRKQLYCNEYFWQKDITFLIENANSDAGICTVNFDKNANKASISFRGNYNASMQPILYDYSTGVKFPLSIPTANQTANYLNLNTTFFDIAFSSIKLMCYLRTNCGQIQFIEDKTNTLISFPIDKNIEEDFLEMLKENITAIQNFEDLHIKARILRQAIDTLFPSINETEQFLQTSDTCYNSTMSIVNPFGITFCLCLQNHSGIQCQIPPGIGELISKQIENIISQTLTLWKENNNILAGNILVYLTSYTDLLELSTITKANNLISKINNYTSDLQIDFKKCIDIILRFDDYCIRNLYVKNYSDAFESQILENDNLISNLMLSNALYNGETTFDSGLNYFVVTDVMLNQQSYNFNYGITINLDTFPYYQAMMLIKYSSSNFVYCNSTTMPISSIDIQFNFPEDLYTPLVPSTNIDVIIPINKTALQYLPNISFPVNGTLLINQNIIQCGMWHNSQLETNKCVITEKNGSFKCTCAYSNEKIVLCFNQTAYLLLLPQPVIDEVIDIRRMGVVLLYLGIIGLYALMFWYYKRENHTIGGYVLKLHLLKECKSCIELRHKCFSAILPSVEQKYAETNQEICNPNDSFSSGPSKNNTGNDSFQVVMKSPDVRASIRKFSCSSLVKYLKADLLHNCLAIRIINILCSNTNNILVGRSDLLITIFWNQIIALIIGSGIYAQFIELDSENLLLKFALAYGYSNVIAILPIICTFILGVLWSIDDSQKEKIRNGDEAKFKEIIAEINKNFNCRQMIGWIFFFFFSGVGGLGLLVWGFITEIDLIYNMLILFMFSIFSLEIVIEIFSSFLASYLYAISLHFHCFKCLFDMYESYRMTRVLS